MSVKIKKNITDTSIFYEISNPAAKDAITVTQIFGTSEVYSGLRGCQILDLRASGIIPSLVTYSYYPGGDSLAYPELSWDMNNVHKNPQEMLYHGVMLSIPHLIQYSLDMGAKVGLLHQTGLDNIAHGKHLRPFFTQQTSHKHHVAANLTDSVNRIIRDWMANIIIVPSENVTGLIHDKLYA